MENANSSLPKLNCSEKVSLAGLLHSVYFINEKALNLMKTCYQPIKLISVCLLTPSLSFVAN